MRSKSRKNKKLTKSAAKKTGLRRWMAVTEELTRCWVPGNLKKASHVFDRLLTSEEQLALVREVVETRTAELVRAYPNVIDVGFGFRRRRRRGSEKYQIVRTPCLHFVVKRKWAKDSDKDPKLSWRSAVAPRTWTGRFVFFSEALPGSHQTAWGCDSAAK